MERRVEERFPTQARAKITLVEHPEHQVECQLSDVSASGIKLLSPEDLPSGALIVVELETLLVLAEVRYSYTRGSKFTIGAQKRNTVITLMLPDDATTFDKINVLTGGKGAAAANSSIAFESYPPAADPGAEQYKTAPDGTIGQTGEHLAASHLMSVDPATVDDLALDDIVIGENGIEVVGLLRNSGATPAIHAEVSPVKFPQGFSQGEEANFAQTRETAARPVTGDPSSENLAPAIAASHLISNTAKLLSEAPFAPAEDPVLGTARPAEPSNVAARALPKSAAELDADSFMQLDPVRALASTNVEYLEPDVPEKRSGKGLRIAGIAIGAIAAGGVLYLSGPFHESFRPEEKVAAGQVGTASASQAAPGSRRMSKSQVRASRPAAQPARATGPRMQAEILARAMNWVSACSDGTETYTKLLLAGDTLNFEFENKAVVRMGNAGAAEITVDGKPLGPVGGPGALSIIEIDGKGYRYLAGLPADGSGDCTAK